MKIDGRPDYPPFALILREIGCWRERIELFTYFSLDVELGGRINQLVAIQKLSQHVAVWRETDISRVRLGAE